MDRTMSRIVIRRFRGWPGFVRLGGFHIFMVDGDQLFSASPFLWVAFGRGPFCLIYCVRGGAWGPASHEGWG